MLPDGFANLLLQIPIVGVLIWFVLTWTDRNQKALDKRDEQLQAFINQVREEDRQLRAQDRSVLEKLVEQIERLNVPRSRGKPSG